MIFIPKNANPNRFQQGYYAAIKNWTRKNIMTSQVKEILIYKGEKLGMDTEPLAQYFNGLWNPPKFLPRSADCWRGYFGTWELKDEKLFLIDICGYVKDVGEKAIESIFPGESEVFAKWFTGEIKIPQGKILEKIPMGYFSVFEKDIFLRFHSGKLSNSKSGLPKSRTINNRISHNASTDASLNEIKKVIYELQSINEPVNSEIIESIKKIINSSEHYRKYMFEILCSYILETTSFEQYQSREKPSLKIQSVLNLLVNTKHSRLSNVEKKADLNDSHLRGANFTQSNLSGFNLRKANLSNAYFFMANLSWADLSYANLSWADLRMANLSNTNLHNAKLSRANLEKAHLYETILTGSDLSNANLREAKISWSYLSEVDLSEANLKGADLDNTNLNKANLKKADLSRATLCDADLSEADLREADLTFAVLCMTNLSKANLCGADLRGADFSFADLNSTNLQGANLSGVNLSKWTEMGNSNPRDISFANLSKADLSWSHFCETDLRTIDLSNANLRGADLRFAILSNVNLNGATLKWADLSNADLSNTNLRGAYIEDANLNKAQLNGAYVDGPDWIRKLKDSKCNGVASIEERFEVITEIDFENNSEVKIYRLKDKFFNKTVSSAK